MRKLLLIGALIMSLALVGCGQYQDGEIKVVVDGRVLQFEEPYKPFRQDGDTYVPAYLIPDVFNQKMKDESGKVINKILVINEIDGRAEGTFLDRTYMIPIDYFERFSESIEFNPQTNTYYITRIENYIEKHDKWVDVDVIRELSEQYPNEEGES